MVQDSWDIHSGEFWLGENCGFSLHLIFPLDSPNCLVTIFMISSIIQGAFLAGGDVIIPDYAAEKYSRVAKLLNWTVLENYHDHEQI